MSKITMFNYEDENRFRAYDPYYNAATCLSASMYVCDTHVSFDTLHGFAFG